MRTVFLALTFLTFTTASLAQPEKAGAYIDSFVKKHNFNGTILIAQQSRTVYRKSFGFANFPFKVPNTPDTKYKIASITKAFTSVLILQLYEQGRINLDKPILTYLPGYKGPAGDKVTVRQLLTMTAGMHNMDDGTTLEGVLKNGMPQYQVPLTPDQLLANYASDTLVAAPGSRFDYNNADFIILGKIINR